MEDSPVTGDGLKKESEATTWWDENRERVEAHFIRLLLAETPRGCYTGPERRSPATVVLDPRDAGLAREQAWGLGIPFEDHARRLFHEAVLAEEERLAQVSVAPRKMGPCKAVEPWRLTLERSA